MTQLRQTSTAVSEPPCIKPAMPSAVDRRPLSQLGATRPSRRPLRCRTCSQTRCTAQHRHINCCADGVPFGLPETARRGHGTGFARPPGWAAFVRPLRGFPCDPKNFVAGFAELGSVPHENDGTDSKANMSARIYQLPVTRSVLLTKKQLAAHLGRSTRWIELQMRRGLPFEGATDRFGSRRYDLAKVEAWLCAGEPAMRREKTLAERVAALELLVDELTRGAP